VAEGRRSGGRIVSENAAATAAASVRVLEKIRASAGSPSHEIVNRRASVATAGVCSEETSIPEIFTGLPASDVLLALETPGST